MDVGRNDSDINEVAKMASVFPCFPFDCIATRENE